MNLFLMLLLDWKISVIPLLQPGGVATIRTYAFANCSNLSSVTIESGVQQIYAWAFSNCTSLTSIYIPSTVVRTYAFPGLYNNVFLGCSNLTDITLDKAEGSIDSPPWGATNATVTWLR